MEDKNFIIFTVLTMTVILLWLFFFAPKPKPKKQAPATKAGSAVAVKGGETVSPEGREKSVKPEPLPGASLQPERESSSPKPLAPQKPEPGKTITVKTDLLEVELAEQSAAPLSWKLLKYPREKCYKYRVDIAWPPFKKNPPCDESPVDLAESVQQGRVHSLAAQVVVDGEKIPPSAAWTLETAGDIELAPGETAARVSFKKVLKDGRAVRKTYVFRPSRYDVELQFTVEGGDKPKRGGVDLAFFYQWNPHQRSGVPSWNYNGPEAHDGKVIIKLDPKDVVKKGVLVREAVEWAGFSYDYFLAAALAEPEKRVSFAAQFLGDEKDKKTRKPKELAGWVRLISMDEDLAEGRLGKVIVYLGPKKRPLLGEVRPTLRASIDYGRLKILVFPLIQALVFTERLVGNYGVAIIILTVVLRMAMFPLTRKGQRAMKDMQKLQPEIQKIREKYPDDRMKQNEEMQALWRKHKINPAMGCLPMLLQFPVFLAFYKALLISIELRQAPFFWWIVDLSARDPLYIWPVLMGATQFITQKMTPTQMDPLQQKILLAMPIIFTYILRDFPAGLLIYWTVQNIVGIGQQIYVNRQSD